MSILLLEQPNWHYSLSMINIRGCEFRGKNILVLDCKVIWWNRPIPIDSPYRWQKLIPDHHLFLTTHQVQSHTKFACYKLHALLTHILYSTEFFPLSTSAISFLIPLFSSPCFQSPASSHLATCTICLSHQLHWCILFSSVISSQNFQYDPTSLSCDCLHHTYSSSVNKVVSEIVPEFVTFLSYLLLISLITWIIVKAY